MLSTRSIFPILSKVTLVVTLSAVALCAAAPRGWYLAGSKPQAYQTGVDETQYNGHRVAYLKAATATEGFGTLMQDFRADDYTGKRVRFSAMLKAESVADWAGLWISFGLLLAGSGNVMMSGAKIETVGLDVPLTAKPTSAGRSHPTAPTNLDFEP